VIFSVLSEKLRIEPQNPSLLTYIILYFPTIYIIIVTETVSLKMQVNHSIEIFEIRRS